MLKPYFLALCFATSLAFGQSQHRAPAPALRFDSTQGTVVVGMAVSEGLVLAADSRAVAKSELPPGYMVVSDSTTKVFAIGKFGAATFGTALLQHRSIATWVSEYKPDPKDDIDSFATHFTAYFVNLFGRSSSAEKESGLGFFLVGYDSSGKGKLLQVKLPEPGKPEELKNTKENQGPAWEGHREAIARLLLGYSEQILDVPPINTMSEDQQRQLLNQLAMKVPYNMPFDHYSLQDAVDFSVEMVRVTKTMQRFAFGTVGKPGDVPGVGGSVDVLVVKGTGPQWVKQKRLTKEE